MQQATLRIKTKDGKVYDIVEARESGWMVKVGPRKWQIIPYREAKEIPFDLGPQEDGEFKKSRLGMSPTLAPKAKGASK